MRNVAMRNAPRYLGHTGELNVATEVALSFPSDGEEQPQLVTTFKAKARFELKAVCSSCGRCTFRKIRTIVIYL